MLEIVGWFELSIHHMVFFHPHKSSIGICFGIAVPVPTAMDLLCVFFQLFQIFFQGLNRLLDLRFSFSVLLLCHSLGKQKQLLASGVAKWRGFMDLQWNRIPIIYEKKHGCLWYKEQMLCRFFVTKLENESATERVV